MSMQLTISRNVSSQLTKTEDIIGRGEQPSDSANYTVTESGPTNPAASWLPSVLEQLQTIAALPDGWDSYGASAPDANKVEAAWSLIYCLCKNTDLPKPSVNPTRNGSVQFEWETGDRYFELEVVAERAATFLYCDEVAHVEETGDLFEEDDALEPVRDFVRKAASLQ
jgi:hypothetical protein